MFIRIHDEDSDKGYLFEVNVKHPKRLYNFRRDLPFLPKRMKVQQACVQFVLKKTMLLT